MLKQKFWFQAHWVVGTTAGVLLALIGVTGASMAFQEPILAALNADVREVPASGPRLPMESLLKTAEDEARRNGVELHSVVVPAATDGAVKVVFESGDHESARLIDPFTGQWLDGGLRGEAFFELMEEIHRGFVTDRLAGDGVGRRIMDAAVVLLIGLVATGLYLRWPRRFTNWRNWFVVDRRLRGRGFLWSLHAVIGTYVLPLLLLSALTGLYYAYGWYRAMLQDIAGVPPAVKDAVVEPLAKPDLAAAWPVFEQATATQSVGRLVIRLPQKEGDSLRFLYFDRNPPHAYATNTVKIDPSTSQLLLHERYADKPTGGKLIASMLAIHKGSYFGVIGSIVMLISSLSLSVFVVTGWMMYLDRRRVEERARKRQAASAPA